MAERIEAQVKGTHRRMNRMAIGLSVLVAVLMVGVIACRPSDPGDPSVASKAPVNEADEEGRESDPSESAEMTKGLSDSGATSGQPDSDSTSEVETFVGDIGRVSNLNRDSKSILDDLLDEADAAEAAPKDPVDFPKNPARGDQVSPFKIVEQDPEPLSDEASADVEYVEPVAYDPNHQTIEIPEAWKRLSKQHEIWLDVKAKQVIVAGEVCLDRGQLEMFICPRNTKEHESVISVNALASQVHASLISLGADAGKPTSWDPEYRAAFGPVIKVTLKWHDAKTNKTVEQSAHQWIRNTQTGKAMDQVWVFGGSIVWVNPDTGASSYLGDGGELICVSNFETATIDLNIESSKSRESLMFEAFTENIPPVGTKVYVILQPGERIEPESKSTKVDPENVGGGKTPIVPPAAQSDGGGKPEKKPEKKSGQEKEKEM